MNNQLHLARRVGTVLVIVALLMTAAGCSLLRSPQDATTDSGGGPVSMGSGGVSPAPPAEADRSAALKNESSVAAPTASPDRLVISNASMTVRVDDVDKALDSVRTIATSSGSQISDLSVQTGDGGGPIPLGAEPASPDSKAKTAQVTLRVPASKLASVETEVAKLGSVLTQSASESDVTQQHVDLAARLKNLQAEEVRVRSFFERATKVTEMLEIERELTRVRGEIEAMQAQISYLEQQAAMATLSISLSAPGSLVQPAGGTWGFTEAVTKGVQAAAALIGVLIFVTIMLLPVAVVVLVIVLIVRYRRRRRAARAAAEAETATTMVVADAPIDDEPGSPTE